MALLAEALIGKALMFAFTPEGMLKLGECSPGQLKGKGKDDSEGHLASKKSSIFPLWLRDATEIIHTLRGIRWKYGMGTYIPPPTRPQERQAFLRATSLSFVRNFLLLDALETCLKIFPGVGLPSGGSIFYPQLPPIPRYTVSTTIHMLTGCALLAGLGMCYDLATFVAVMFLGDTSSSWPPVLYNPWGSDSLHSLWAKHWHQLLRQTFLIFGGYPGRWLAGDVGLVLGTFLASGLYHELAIYTMGRGLDHTVTFFFAIQGPLLILERVWRRVTGRRVGGLPGRLWVYSIMFLGGQCMVDSWHRRGLAGCLVIPPMISPVRLALLAMGFGRRR
ncbi:unnamed protein product [Mycena citricolor]|uniref:Wax synthase domain-containing protein n=1 Tax=Mycena citricolor TaxID=2018698 RepID=A0AAD2HXL1_9AGAR|nr:unnamed protein product [Mycena citricolor]